MTKAERAHVDAVKRAGCLCCIARGFEPADDAPAVEAHHLLSGGIRIDHSHVAGLCIWHHKARLYVEGWDTKAHRLHLGPNLQQEAKEFHRIFGSDEDLLRMQAKLLGEET